jgi:signal transduction histidine kinase
VRPLADEKGIEMRCSCPDGLGLVQTDGAYLEQILLNLVGNAIKFTDEGFVSVVVSRDESGVVVAVEDSGCGIEGNEIDRVFDDFYQASANTRAKAQGTGLGLAVSRRLAESIGAQIDVSSEPSRGSVFTLRLPDQR